MAYRIEYRNPIGLPFYAEIGLVDQAGNPVRIGATKHSFVVGAACSTFDDYGWAGLDAPSIEATTDNGMVQSFEPGIIVVTIPAAQLPRFCDRVGGTTLPFRLTATKANGLASVVAEGTITFGDR